MGQRCSTTIPGHPGARSFAFSRSYTRAGSSVPKRLHAPRKEPATPMLSQPEKRTDVRWLRLVRPDDAQWQRFWDRLTNALLFAAGQSAMRAPTRQDIYDALEDVFGDDFRPDELEHLTNVVLKALR